MQPLEADVEVSQSLHSEKSQASPLKVQNQNDLVFTLVVIPPDGGWGWVILTASFFINFIMDGTIYSIGLFLNEIAKSMETYPTRVAYAGSILVGVNLLSAPIVCGLTNKYGFRIITFTGGIIASIVLFASSFVKNLYVFLFVFGVFGGMAFSSIYVPSVVIVGFYFERWRALASAISVCGTSFGIIFYPLILNNLLIDYTWSEKFQMLSVSFLVISALSLTFISLSPVGIQPNPEPEESVLSVFLDGDHKGLLAKMHSSSRNIQNPQTTEVQDTTPQTLENQNMRRNYSSSSTLVASSGYPGGSSTAVSKLSTIFEDEIQPTWRNLGINLWRKLCSCFECCRFRRLRPTISTISRPMYRDDIFFTGSVYTLPEYQKPSIKGTVSSLRGFASKKSAIDYHISVTRVATQKDLEEETKPFICCPVALKRIVCTMMDIQLLKSTSFVFLIISGFFVSLGMYIPFIFIVQRAIENKIDQSAAAMFVTGLGIANLIGRIITGVLASIPGIDALVVNYVGIFIAGIPAILFAFADELWMYYLFIGLYGSAIAAVPTMKTIVLVDLVGLEKLTNAFGITLMFQGISSFIGLPLAGLFIESTNSYGSSFVYCGVTLLLSGLSMVPIKFIKHYENKKKTVNEQPENKDVVE